ncbi:hypothetical protein CY0110_19972 [Crocosphaera chwakensis CCY0110]|uniref:Uncharacterized protein n=1 Tax=Crocosphaera chwakensis CCY0110 TaxID=391612 RepID=A3IJX6_9CHRO|nr:hypothetical protein CY0110_19972 [Crocosphaera chwakensis CCY0110]
MVTISIISPSIPLISNGCFLC